MGKSKIQQKRDLKEKEVKRKKEMVRKRYERDKSKVSEDEKRDVLGVEENGGDSQNERPSEMYTVSFLLIISLAFLPIPSFVASIIFSLSVFDPSLIFYDLTFLIVRICLISVVTYGFFSRLAKWGYYGMLILAILGVVLNIISFTGPLAIFNMIIGAIGIGLNIFAIIILVGNADTKELLLKKKKE